MIPRAVRLAVRFRARRWCRLAAAFGFTLLLAGASAPRAQQPLVADLSSHVIAITTGFVGTSVVLFGAVEGPGDVLILVRGPESVVSVFRKERVLGLWMNTDRLTFRSVPSFYLVASSRPLEEMIPEALSDRLSLGLAHLRFDSAAHENAKVFQDALIRIKQRQGLFASKVGAVSFLGGRLFRTNIYFPSNVPTGTYVVETYLIRDGEIVTAQTTPLVVSKIGMEAWIHRFAHDFPALYGSVAVLCALMAGWAAALVFRRI